MAIMKNHHHPHFHTPKIEASVGLAIVSALHLKPSNTGGEILINHIVLSNPRSDPIPVITNNNNNNNNIMVDDEDEDENYTYVTSRGAANPVTRVYHHRPTGDGGCVVTTLKPLMYSKVEDQTSNKNIDKNDNSNELSNFLSSCDMCRKNLAGKDIYMYRGEKAFCSEECRHRQIASDEREEKLCRRRPSKTTSSVSRSPCYYETGHIFSTGIISIY